MKTLKVKFVKAHFLFAHDPGEVAELLESDAKKLIDSGHAVSAKNAPVTETATVKAEAETAVIPK